MLDLRVDHGQHEVDVVDHEVDDDADFGASARQARARRRVLRKAVRLDEARVGRIFFQKIHCRVEAFDMAHGEDDIVLPRRFHHLFGEGKIGFNRFFHEDVLAHLKKRNRRHGVKIGRNRHAEGIAFLRKLPPVGKNRQIELRPDLRGRLGLDVEDADHLRIRALGIETGVVPAECPDTEYADFELFVAFHS